MTKLKDLTGLKFGDLIVIERGSNVRGRVGWICQCSCGNIKTVQSLDLNRRNYTRSCGCLRYRKLNDSMNKLKGTYVGKLKLTEPCTFGGVSAWLCQCECGEEKIVRQKDLKRNNPTKSCGCIHLSVQGLSAHRLYSTHGNMMARCYNKNRHDYERYGGRGISVTNRWHNVINFIDDMDHSFKGGLSLDRIDNNGDYNKNNCRWATIQQQNCNTRFHDKDVDIRKSKSGLYKVRISLDGKRYHLGSFNNKDDAIEVIIMAREHRDMHNYIRFSEALKT